MTIRTWALVLVAVASIGCHADDPRKIAKRAVAARPDLSQAKPADLAIEIDQAERRGTWREVRQRWEGQQLHWVVTRQRALCVSATACNVAAFPVQRPATHGWLPQLRFAPGEFDKLSAGCGDAASCELEIEGTLTKLELSGELPTSVYFDHVRVVGARKS
ncbi:MAG TPA: hypothetical protein VIV40_17580 [Kofleriaceae bacterium]